MAKLNYSGSVASYDTRPRNKMGLFNNTTEPTDRQTDRQKPLTTLDQEMRWSYSLILFALSHMHHLTCGINSLLHSVNLIMFTLLLVHLILRISPHHSHHLHSHHLSLPLPSTPDLKLISFTNPFLRSHF